MISSFLYDIVINLVECWVILLLAQYICSAHLQLRRRNVVICSGILLVCIVAGLLISGESSTILTVPLALVLTVLLFSRRRLTDLLCLAAALAIFFAVMVIPMGILDTIFPGGLSRIFPGEFSAAWFSLISDIVALIALILLGRILAKYQISLHFRAKEILASIALAIFAFIDLGLIMFIYYKHLSLLHRAVMLTIFLAAFIFSIGYFVYGIVSSRRKIYQEALSRSETEYLRLQLDSLQIPGNRRSRL